MSRMVRAIFENGVFRPTEPVELPERSEVEFEPRLVNGIDVCEEVLDDVYAILQRRYRSGEIDVAARHSEHQP